MFILLVFAWLAAPIVEMVIIIVLCVQNGEYKRKIAELSKNEQRFLLAKGQQLRTIKAEENVPLDERTQGESACTSKEENKVQEMQTMAEHVPDRVLQEQKEAVEYVPDRVLQEQREAVGYVPDSAVQEQKEAVEHVPDSAVQEQKESSEYSSGSAAQELQTPLRQPMGMDVESRAISDNSLGTAALIIGVILIVLAGIIFATTSWRFLPSFCKVFLVLALAGVFFGASVLAEKKLHIYKTGNAFYVLSSIFLFLSILAAAYFKLLGAIFILEGSNRWWVLWGGSLVTLSMLFLGIRKFHDKTYTQACFWGMTISMTFFLSAWDAKWELFISAMTIYAFLLVVGEWIISDKIQVIDKADSKRAADIVALLEDGFRGFAPAHFWIFAVLQVFYGVLGSFYLFGLRPSWYVILALAAAAAGSMMQAQKMKGGWPNLLFSLSVASSIHCAMAWGFFWLARENGRGIVGIFVTTEILVAVVLAQWITVLCFILGQKKKFWMRTNAGDGIYTAFILVDSLILLINAMIGPGIPVRYLLSFIGMLPVLFAAFLWESDFPVIRRLLPLLFWYMMLPIHGYINCERSVFYSQLWTGFCDWVDRGLLEFLLLSGLMVWNRRKKMGFGLAVFIIGTVAQVLYFSESRLSFPFFLLLSLFMAGEKTPFGYRAAALCSMIGCYVLVCPFTTENLVLRSMIVICVYWVWMAVDKKLMPLLITAEKPDEEQGLKAMDGEAKSLIEGWEPETVGDIFWDVCGCILMAYMMIAFYRGSHLAIWNLLFCLTMFVGLYMKFYFGRQIWPHLFITFFMIPVPTVLLLRYGWSENLLYGVVGACYLVTGMTFRYRYLIVEKDAGVLGGWRVDWYHVMAFVVLAPMAFMDYEGIWRFLYLLLIGIYFLQYTAVKSVSRLAWSGAAASMVVAFWNQPFIRWPDLLEMKITLLPVAVFIWGMGYIWRETDLESDGKRGRAQAIRDVQTAGYVFLLLALCLEAWANGDVANALILEGLCLGIFLWAQMAKNRRWVSISGTVVVVLALYMTKGFWLSISWWVYLLAAGVGLIVFAAANEKKKH